MNNLKEYILEKFKVSSNNIKREFEFNLEGFKEKIKLPFNIEIVELGKLQKVYSIDVIEGKTNFYRLFDEDDKVITYFEEEAALKFFKNKQKIWVTIYYLDGLDCYRSYVIKLKE